MAIEEKKDGMVEEPVEDTEDIEDTEDTEDTEGAEGGTGGSGGDKGGNGSAGNDGKKKAPRMFTQDEVTRMMTREKKQGRNAVLRELGIDPKDTKTINLLQSVMKSKSGGQSEDDGRTAELEHRALVAEAKAEAMQQGAQAEYVDDIVTLALNKAEEDSDISTLVGEVKTKYPVWFGKQAEDGDDKKGTGTNKVGAKGTGASVKSKSPSKKDEQNIGARLAAQRKARNSTKKSFWG